MKLYELSNDYQQLLDEIAHPSDTGEISTQALQELDTLKDAIENKAVAISGYIGNLRAELQSVKEAREAMQEREKRLVQRMEYFENYLIENMEKCGITEIKSSPYFTIKLKKCPPSVEIFDNLLLPVAYTKEKITTSPDKLKIAADIKAGKMVPGATLITRNKVEIK